MDECGCLEATAETITSVDLRSNNFGDEGMKALADTFRANKTVTALGLTIATSDRRQTTFDEGLQALASAMEVNEAITVDLDMSKDELARLVMPRTARQAIEDIQRFCTRNEVREVCQSCRSQSIRQVQLFSSNLGKEHLKALGDALRISQTVTFVDLDGNNFGDEGVKALADAIRANESIITLCLGRNNFGNEGLKALADALRINQTVEIVDLSSNNFGDEGVKALADALRINKTIAHVRLGGNNFGNEGLKALASAMEVNETVTLVNLGASRMLGTVNLDMSRMLRTGHQAIEDIQRFCTRNAEVKNSSRFHEEMDDAERFCHIDHIRNQAR